LQSRLFIIPFAQRFLGFYEQSNTLDVMRLWKQVNRLDLGQLVAQFLVEFDISGHGGWIAGDIGDFVRLHGCAGLDKALG